MHWHHPVGQCYLEVVPSRLSNPGGLCKPNLVSYGKFRPANIVKAKKYPEILDQLDPVRVKSCDKNSLKGWSIYNKNRVGT